MLARRSKLITGYCEDQGSGFVMFCDQRSIKFFHVAGIGNEKLPNEKILSVLTEKLYLVGTLVYKILALLFFSYSDETSIQLT